MKIKELSLSDLKAAYDFVKIDLSDLEKEAKENNIEPTEIPAYNEVRKMENDLYHELLNKTRFLK